MKRILLVSAVLVFVWVFPDIDRRYDLGWYFVTGYLCYFLVTSVWVFFKEINEPPAVMLERDKMWAAYTAIIIASVLMTGLLVGIEPDLLYQILAAHGLGVLVWCILMHGKYQIG